MTMSDKPKSPCLLMFILPPRLADKTAQLFSKGGVPFQYRFSAEGTATSRVMDMLGLGSSEKCLLVNILPKFFADEMLAKAANTLQLDSVNSGIGFTVPVTGINSMLMQMLKQADQEKQPSARKEEETLSEAKYAMVSAIVERGFSEEVMEAARSVGAKGGTVLHSHSIGNEEIMNFWGLNVQKEKDVVLILTEVENKLKIMRAISERCGLHSDAKGIVLSFPIDTVIGIPEEKKTV